MNDQRDAQILFYVFISIYNSLHVSSTQCSSSGETVVSIQPLVTVYVGGQDVCRLEEPAHILATNIDCYQRLYWNNCLSWCRALCARNMQRVVNRNKHIEENLCITLVIHQESLYDVRSTKCKRTLHGFHLRLHWLKTQKVTLILCATCFLGILYKTGKKNYVETMSVHDLATVTKPPVIFSWNLVQKFFRGSCSASTSLKRIDMQWRALFT